MSEKIFFKNESTVITDQRIITSTKTVLLDDVVNARLHETSDSPSWKIPLIVASIGVLSLFSGASFSQKLLMFIVLVGAAAGIVFLNETFRTTNWICIYVEKIVGFEFVLLTETNEKNKTYNERYLNEIVDSINEAIAYRTTGRSVVN